MNSKQTYRQFCKLSKRPLIFQTPLWLDAVVGNKNWDVILAFKGNTLTGAMPYVRNTKWGLKLITMPQLTNYLGPMVLFPHDLSINKKHSFEREVISQIVAQIPKSDRFVIQTDFEFDYWLPFYWEGYQQTTRYSYIINTEDELDNIFQRFNPNTRNTIKKASSRFLVKLGNSPNRVFDLYQTDFKRKQLQVSFTKELLLRIDKAIAPTQNRIILEAVGNNGQVIAALYLVLDNRYLHYSFGAVEFSHRQTGVMSLLIWYAIVEAKHRNLIFNFGGSMNKSIERFFLGFRGELTPYFRVFKVNNFWLKHFTVFQPK